MDHDSDRDHNDVTEFQVRVFDALYLMGGTKHSS